MKVTHANLNEEIIITESLIAAAYYSKAHSATLVLFSGGAMIPVTESKEDIYKQKEDIDGK